MDLLPFLIFPLLLTVGGLYDLTTMTIPNWVSGVLIASFLVLAVYAGLPWQVIGISFAVFGATLVFGMVCFALGWFGGGDAKFIAATALWFGFPAVTHFLVWMMILGGAAAACLILFRKFALPSPAQGIGWVERLHHAETGLPYGAAIAGAGLIMIGQSPVAMALLG